MVRALSLVRMEPMVSGHPDLSPWGRVPQRRVWTRGETVSLHTYDGTTRNTPRCLSLPTGR